MQARLQAELLARRITWPASVGLLLVVLGTLAHLWWLPAQERKVRSLEGEYRRAILQVSAPAPIKPVTPSSGNLLADRYAAFTQVLPQQTQAPEQIKVVFAEAQKAGLILAQAEYRLTEDKAGSYFIYQMTLPVKGPYLKLRQFIEGVLVSVPSMALEEVSFRREGIGVPSAEARLRFTFFLKGLP